MNEMPSFVRIGFRDIAQLKQAADIIVEQSENYTYLGFLKPGQNYATLTDKVWSIMRIGQSIPGGYPNYIEFMWAEGNCLFNLSFEDRFSYNYWFRNF